MTNRREFIGLAGAFALMGRMDAAAETPSRFAWSYLAHFGMNMWGDLPKKYGRGGAMSKWLTDEEFEAISHPPYSEKSHIRFDHGFWKDLSAKLKAAGCNQIVVDVGEFMKYPSHPEIAVQGSWEASALADEVGRLKGMGFEVVPKLNFSTCHDAWMGVYARMVSTAKYYEVCADIIRDTLEVFCGTPYLHIGMDEEDQPPCHHDTSMIVMRRGDLWWHDLLFFVKEIEKRGVRAWMFQDYLRYHSPEEFVRRMPKTVLQSPWNYQLKRTDKEPAYVKLYRTLSDNGYDVVPCGSNCYGVNESFGAYYDWCKVNIAPERLVGMQMAPWLGIFEPYRRLHFAAADLIAAETGRKA